MLNRRSFLVAIGAALTLDPERALFVPGKKLISIPKARLVTDEAAIRSYIELCHKQAAETFGRWLDRQALSGGYVPAGFSDADLSRYGGWEPLDSVQYYQVSGFTGMTLHA